LRRKPHGGVEAGAVQSDAGGIRERSVDTIARILRRGVLLDVSSAARVDLRKVALAKSAAHAEQWSIADRARVPSTQLPAVVCGAGKLSPDGWFLACLDLKGTLNFFDVASGQAIFEKKKYVAEREKGEVGLYEIGKGLKVSCALPGQP
jgi:hypothetical protein